MINKKEVKEIIKSKGFSEIQEDLFMKLIIDEIRFYCDFRHGSMKCYAYDKNGIYEHKSLEEYKDIICFIESKKCKTLDKFIKSKGVN